MNLIPNLTFSNIYSIKFNEIQKGSFFFDFDNTLMPWYSDCISKNVLELLLKLKRDNKRIVIASNGKGKRFEQLKKQLPKDIDVLQGLRKPQIKRLQKYLKENNIDVRDSVFIGDNLITDIYTANKLQMYTIKVKPIGLKEFWATKIYRVIELFIYLIFSKQFKEIYEKSNINR